MPAPTGRGTVASPPAYLTTPTATYSTIHLCHIRHITVSENTLHTSLHQSKDSSLQRFSDIVCFFSFRASAQ